MQPNLVKRTFAISAQFLVTSATIEHVKEFFHELEACSMRWTVCATHKDHHAFWSLRRWLIEWIEIFETFVSLFAECAVHSSRKVHVISQINMFFLDFANVLQILRSFYIRIINCLTVVKLLPLFVNVGWNTEHVDWENAYTHDHFEYIWFKNAKMFHILCAEILRYERGKDMYNV